MTPPPQTKGNPGFFGWIGIIIGILFLLYYVFGRTSHSASSPTITYRVSGGTHFASLTYQNAQGGTEQRSTRVPWEMTFTAKHGAFMYLSAQSEMLLDDITCEILVDGQPFKRSTSRGEYVIASCSGAVP